MVEYLHYIEYHCYNHDYLVVFIHKDSLKVIMVEYLHYIEYHYYNHDYLVAMVN